MRRSNTWLAARSGLTLVEVLVVLGLIGLVISLILPAVERVRASAGRAECMNNMRQIGLALHMYHDLKGSLPPSHPKQTVFPNNDPNTMLSWMALILAQIGEETLWEESLQACLAGPNPTDNPPHIVYATAIRAYVCPADAPRLLAPLSNATYPPAAFSSYLGIAGAFGLDGPAAIPPRAGPLGQAVGIRFAQITDGTSRTLLIGERPPPTSLQAGRWYPGAAYGFNLGGPNEAIGFPFFPGADPQCQGITIENFGPGQSDNPCDRYHLWSWHGGGGNFLFCDGSGRFLSYTVNPLIPALSTIAGGENVWLDD